MDDIRISKSGRRGRRRLIDPVEQVGSFLSPKVRRALMDMPKRQRDGLMEIRLRKHMPVVCVFAESDLCLCSGGDTFELNQLAFGRDVSDLLVMDDEEWVKAVQLVTSSSLYALERELKAGFITIKGGHRVGIVGRTVYQNGQLSTQSQISSLNFRIGRDMRGISNRLMPYIVEKGRMRPRNVLLISPPGLGKTTVLRDISRSLSYGLWDVGFKGCKVSVVDERSEIAACDDGVPQYDLGPRTDVLDGCDKRDGITMMVRSMSPDIVVVDEIGAKDDADAINEAVRSGVGVMATAHAKNLDDAMSRKTLGELLTDKTFDLAITLGRSLGFGTVESVHCLKSGSDLNIKPFLLLPERYIYEASKSEALGC